MLTLIFMESNQTKKIILIQKKIQKIKKVKILKLPKIIQIMKINKIIINNKKFKI